MKHFSIATVIFTTCLLFSCQSPQEQQETLPNTTIIVHLANTEQDQLEVFNIEHEIQHQFSGTIDSFSFTLEEETILDFVQGRSHNYIHVKPGSRLTIDTISSKPIGFSIKEGTSIENEYLIAFAKLNTEFSKDPSFRMRKIAAYQADSFLVEIAKKYAPYDQLLVEINDDTEVSASFKSAMTTRALSTKGNDLLVYKDWHNHLNEEYPTLPENFYKETEALELSHSGMLIFDATRSFSKSWATKDVVYEDYESDGDYFTALIESSKNSYPNSLVSDYCFMSSVSDQVNFGSGIDGVDELVKDFKANVSNSYLNNKLDETLEPWLNLKAGMDAPNFAALTRDGAPVNLSDLKGKKVYVDVWATWCGPCIREIPSLKTLEAELHEENIEFVSVSIDKEADKQKWLDFIEKEELKGTQLMAEGDWKSTVTTSYNIKGIPRFFLIDEAGKILNANAPRPSDPKIKEVLMK